VALTILGLDAGERVAVHSSYARPRSPRQWALFTSPLILTPATSYLTLAAAARAPADVSNVTALASYTDSADVTHRRTVRRAMNPPVDLSVTLPPPFVTTAPTIDASPLRRATVTIPIAPSTLGIADYFANVYTPVTSFEAGRDYTMRIMSGYAAGQSTLTITTPDLSALPGWTDELVLRTGVAVQWFVERGDRNMAFDALPVDGRHSLESSVEGELPAL
jgi:hypothetical protein